MKLYTEEQVRTIIGKAQLLDWDDEFLFSEDYLISSENPIELPSDEEINYYANDNVESISFVNGAIWMRDKLKVLKDEE